MSEEEKPLSSTETIYLSKTALKAASRLKEEIEDILRYLNISRLNYSQTPCPLAEIPQLVTELSQQLGLASLTISQVEGEADISLPLSCQAVESILREILENACKFHPQQSPAVDITMTCLDQHSLKLKIADDGLTLSPEQLLRVWLPYYQGEKYFTGEATGIGLGLSMVASMVWSVGGSCRLYNRDPGPGVVVALTLPLNKTTS